MSADDLKIGVILAGGQSRRMGGFDKAEFLFNGARLVDHVLARLAPQVDYMVLSARSDYETGLDIIADTDNAPSGPAGGFISVAHALAKSHSSAEYFYSVPVDAPLCPDDLIARLGAAGGPAIARSPSGLQPTFGRWPIKPLATGLSGMGASISLQKLALICEAAYIDFETDDPFLNINRPRDAQMKTTAS